MSSTIKEYTISDDSKHYANGKKLVIFPDEKIILKDLYDPFFPFEINFNSLLESYDILPIRDSADFISFSSKQDKHIVMVPVIDYNDSDKNKRAISFSIFLRKKADNKTQVFLACIGKEDKLYKTVLADMAQYGTSMLYVPSVALLYRKAQLDDIFGIPFNISSYSELEDTVNNLVVLWDL